MRKIQSRLVQIFTAQIVVLSVAGAFYAILSAAAVNQYKAISDDMVSEYHLTDAAFGLITEYNKLAVSSTTDGQAAQKAKIQDLKQTINQIYARLDNSSADTNTKNAYIGLKNTISALESEIDAGVASNEASGDQTAHYNKANLLYGFVKEDGNVFLSDELRYITTIQKHINQSKTRDFQIGTTVYVLALVGSIIYATRISKVIVKPINKLTTAAEQITQGKLDTAISPELLQRQDETGRLSNAFNVMLLKLRENIHALNAEKASVEQKVVQRTEELNDEKARLEASIDSLDVGFIMTDTNDDIIMLNRVATQLLAYTVTSEGISKIDPNSHQWTTELVDQKMGKDFSFKQNVSKAKSLAQTIEKKELQYGGRSFRIFIAPIAVSDQADESAEALGTVTLIEDITEQKVQERSKDEFFSIASHELRTPLTAIRGNTSAIQAYYKDQLGQDENLRGLVDDIYESSVRLLEIVNDFLDASRLEQGKMKFAPETFELNTVIESVIYELGHASRAKGTEFKFQPDQQDIPLGVYAEKDRTKQVVYNLLGNALKFTEKGTITVDIKPENTSLRVFVTDTGTGMSTEAQQLLFHKFQQAGNSLLTRDGSRGTGLGLYISKLIVEGMGGTIRLESSAHGKGSTFSFSLPTKAPNHPK